MRRALVLVALVGCAAPSAPGGLPAQPGFPPSDADALIRHLQPVVQPFGLEMTRASLIDLDANYQSSPTGRHLALYVEPSGDYPPERYVGNVAPLTAALVEVFHRWPELESFDICQEPIGNTAEAPPPVTRVNVPRTDALTIRWDDIDLANRLAVAMIRYGNEDPEGLRVEVFGAARRHPAYREAERRATRIAADAESPK
jgi:hypothetical protein